MYSSELARVAGIYCMTQVVQLQGQFRATPLTAVNYHRLSYQLPNYLGSPSPYHCTALIYPKPNYSLEGDCSSDLCNLSDEQLHHVVNSGKGSREIKTEPCIFAHS